MAEPTGNPLLDALPPVTDYLSYATIVEQYLSRDNLQILHELLQKDEKLAVNIGWDLIHPLLPLLPDSRPCLLTVAHLGNPREVLLKVTESLRVLDFEPTDTVFGRSHVSDGGEGLDKTIDGQSEQVSRETDNVPAAILGATAATTAKSSSSSSPTSSPPAVQQFQILLTLLSILHARIKTKFPSRFLSTSLSAILVTLSQSHPHLETLTPSVLEFILSVSGTLQPPLPPRAAAGGATSGLEVPEPAALSVPVHASDPEASQDRPSALDDAIYKRLLQAFVTHLTELYVTSPSLQHDPVGLGLTDRLEERLEPSRIIPHRETVTSKFASIQALQNRLGIFKRLSNLADVVKLDTSSLLNYISTPRSSSQSDNDSDDEEDEDEVPESPDAVPLSSVGSLVLFMFKSTETMLDANSSRTIPVEVSIDYDIFPQQLASIRAIAGPGDFGGILGVSDAVLDCILAMTTLALHNNSIGAPGSDEAFNEFLQSTSLMSANSPSSSIRYHAHKVTSTVLRSHPDDRSRLAFIKDTLEHCPYDNLRVVAVSWVKGEIMEANPPMGSDQQLQTQGDTPPLFSSSAGLDAIAENLFPDLTVQLSHPSIEESWTEFKSNFAFYVAVLNLYYLLLSAKYLHRRLAIKSFHTSHDLGGSFLGPLKEAAKRFGNALEEDAALAQIEGPRGTDQSKGELMLLSDALERIDKAVIELNKEV